ncbi:hypothetical protein [Paenibacillus sp. FSL H8-0537]|uniref:hypothetical protein n=1 Tax=Paenibacillus sp. FSL H8-0537 TaxID=2921399 RepID=UPI003100FD8F
MKTCLEEAHQEAKQKVSSWDEQLYIKGRVVDRIELLSDLLPQFLVENKAIYSILSKGMHELSEQSCLEMFPVLLLSIELILDEKIEMQLKQRKISGARKSISALMNKLK